MAEERVKNFKKGVDSEESREKRHELSVSLRRDRLNEQLTRKREQRTDAADLPKEWRLVLNDSDEHLKYQMYRDKMEELCVELQRLGPKNADDLRMPSERQQALSHVMDQIERVLRERYAAVDIFLANGLVLTAPCLAVNITNGELLYASLSLLNLLSAGMRYHENEHLVRAHVPKLAAQWANLDDDVLRPLIFDTLANLALDGGVGRTAVLQADVLRLAQVTIAESESDDAAAAAANCISCLITARPLPALEVCGEVLQRLVPMLESAQPQLATCAMWAIRAMFTSTDVAALQMITSAVSPQHMVHILQILNAAVAGDAKQTRMLHCVALTTIGAAVAKTDSYTAALTAAGLFARMSQSLRTGSAYEIEHALLLLANLTCTEAARGTAVQLMADAGIYDAARDLGVACIHTVRKNRALLFSMSAHAATDDQLRMLVDKDLIFHIVDALGLPDTDLALAMMRDFRMVVDRLPAARNPDGTFPLDAPNPVVAKALEHDMPVFLQDILAATRNREMHRMAQSLLDSYFPDVEGTDVPSTSEPASAPAPWPEVTEEEMRASQLAMEADKAALFTEINAAIFGTAGSSATATTATAGAAGCDETMKE